MSDKNSSKKPRFSTSREVESAIAKLRATLPDNHGTLIDDAEREEMAERVAARKARRKAHLREEEVEANKPDPIVLILVQLFLKIWLGASALLLSVGIILTIFDSDIRFKIFGYLFGVIGFGIGFLVFYLFIVLIYTGIKGLLSGEISAEDVLSGLANSSNNSESNSKSNGSSYYQAQVRGGTTWLNIGGPRNEMGAIDSVDYESSRNPGKNYRVVEIRNGRIVGTVYSR